MGSRRFRRHQRRRHEQAQGCAFAALAIGVGLLSVPALVAWALLV